MEEHLKASGYRPDRIAVDTSKPRSRSHETHPLRPFDNDVSFYRETEAETIRKSAKALEEAGVFSIVGEGVPVDLAADLANHVDVPIIGIGAGQGTDGQILVSDDMFGLFNNFKHKFVRRFGNVAGEIEQAAEAYRAAVGSFLDQIAGVTP